MDNANGHGVALDFDSKPAESTDTPSIDGGNLLNRVQQFITKYVVLTEAQAVTVALWIVHTWLFKASIYTPYLAVTSATKRCGKSRLMETCTYLVRDPWWIAGTSSAALFREIERRQPTLFLDETDALFQGSKEAAQDIRGVLNSGNHYKGTTARVVGQGTSMKTQNFRTFCPKSLGGIGNLPDTVADRSLHIRLQRKSPNTKVSGLRERDAKPIAEPIRAEIGAWASSIFAAVRDARPEHPREITDDRQQDAIEILLAIADQAGGDWRHKARKALVEVCTSDAAKDDDYRTQLLADIKAVYEDENTTSMACKTLVEKLRALETAPWNDWRGGKGLSPSGLGKLLQGFGIQARQVWDGTDKKNVRHYSLEDFKPVFAVYLPSIALTPLEPAKTLDETHISHTARTASLAGCETDENASKNAASSAISGIKTENGGSGAQKRAPATDQPPSDVGAMADVEARLKQGLPVAPELLKEYQERWLPWLATNWSRPN